MLIDIVTFLFAVGALLVIHVPQPERTQAGVEGKGSLLQEASYGFRYILRRPSLLGLQLTFLFVNLTAGFGNVLVNPMLLARTNKDETVLATVTSLGALGGVLGGILMSTWGGPKRRVHGVLLGLIFSSFFGLTLMGVGQSVLVWGAAWALAHALYPILNGSNQAIWQAKVAPDVQGRVFAARRMIAQMVVPIGMLLAGPLADRVFEPALMPGGALTPAFGWLVGTGPGAGMGLINVIFGVIGVLAGVAGFAFTAIRNAEDLLPDHGAEPAPAPETEPVAATA
jgi:hypothetical protein